MRMLQPWKPLRRGLVLLAVIAVTASVTTTVTSRQQAAEDDVADRSRPGPEHDRLSPLVGRWKQVITFRESPDAPPSVGLPAFALGLAAALDRVFCLDFCFAKADGLKRGRNDRSHRLREHFPERRRRLRSERALPVRIPSERCVRRAGW